MSMHARLAKLEARCGQEVPIWCNRREDVDATISEMVTEGSITASDRRLCVYWEDVTAIIGAHERALSELSR